MIKTTKSGIYYTNKEVRQKHEMRPEEAKKGTITYGILSAHNISKDENQLKIKFDAIASHDITYVGIIQTARASGLKEFPLPYILTNCHNSLCAVGGTINEDDHAFGLSAAKRYGGIYVPAHQAVIHSYMRERYASCGKMILGSDSHTRYGALGCMAIGEGGPELVKQLLSKTYDISYPEVICVHLTGAPKTGVGPQDVALALIKEVFASGFVKNKVLEFVGEGISSLPMEFRNGIDVMTTETTCLSSIWETDEKTKRYLELHGRARDYRKLAPADVAYYDGLIEIDLSTIEPMIALPFHPSNAYTIKEFLENAQDILASVEQNATKQLGIQKGRLDLRSKLKKDGFYVDQGVIAGCAGGTYDNLCAASDILENASTGQGHFSLSIYPASQPVMLELIRSGRASKLITAGATLRSAFCGPCFGAGDVPSNGSLSIRHSTRNFPNREGSKPGENQIAAVALMDSRSIAATAARGGKLTPATELDINYSAPDYKFDDTVYKNRVYNGYGRPEPETPLVFGPNIADWPAFSPAADCMLIKTVSVINDPVTTTDELIPSGDTSSYRSNPEKLSSFALSRKDPSYVPKAKQMRELEHRRLAGEHISELDDIYKILAEITDAPADSIMLGSLICAVKPGDGSAREQAASCQRVLGGLANIANEYATKRYRSNLINWGILPFTVKGDFPVAPDDFVFLSGVRSALEHGINTINAKIIPADGSAVRDAVLSLDNLSKDDRRILLDGCLINYYKN